MEETALSNAQAPINSIEKEKEKGNEKDEPSIQKTQNNLEEEKSSISKNESEHQGAAETPYSVVAASEDRKHSDATSISLKAEKVPENIVGTIEDGAASIKSEKVRISGGMSADVSPSESPAAIQTASTTASGKPTSLSFAPPGEGGESQTNGSMLSRSTTTRTTHSSSSGDGSVSGSEEGSHYTSNTGGGGSVSKGGSSSGNSSYSGATGSESASMSQNSSSSPRSQVKTATTGSASSAYSPEKPPSIHIPVFEGSPELSQLATFYYSLDTKYYHSGYVYKLNALGVDGTPMFKDASPQVIAENGGYWSKWWMELVGPVLHLWRVPDEVASFGYTASLSFEQLVKNELDPPIEVMDTIKTFQEAPLQINFADSVVEVFPSDFTASSFPGNPAPPIPYNNFFSLTTASSNLFLFASASVIQMNYWVCSIRLAMFELQRLNQLFTQRILHQAERIPVWNQFGLKPFSSGEYRGEILYEGPLQIRLPYSTIWKQVYAVVTSKYGPEAFSIAKTTSKLFSKKEATKEFDPSKRGTILIYESKKAAQKGKLPLVTLSEVRSVYAIWPSNSQESQVRNVSLAKVECVFQLAEPPLNNFDSERTFTSFFNGMPQIRQIEDIEKLISGADPRPEPTDLLILTSNTQSLTQWIVSILSAFSLDSESPLLEDEAKQMSMVQEDVEGATTTETVKWPSQLYLSLDEVGGVTMPRFSLEESKILFGHYLLQKVMYSKNGTLKTWSQNISKGEWERGLCDRKEMEWKLTFLFNWVEKVVLDLKENNIIVSKPHPTILVSAMATVMGWLGPVLASMVGSASNITPQSANPPSLTGSGNDAPSIGSKSEGVKSIASESSSDGDGSVSEEERSSEGSQSEEEESTEKQSDQGSSSYNESYQSMTKSSVSQAVTGSTQSKSEAEESTSASESDEEFEVYEPNSLLSKVTPSKLPVKGQGPFFDTTGELNHRQSMLAAATTQYQKKEIGGGPLLGIVQDPANKPKLQTGLLGEIERREEETKQLGFRASIMPTSRMSFGALQTPDTTLLQLNNITQKMMETLNNPGPGTLDSLRDDLVQLQSIISQGLQRKRSSMIVPNSATNPFAMPTITWSRSNSSNRTPSDTSPVNNKKKSFESVSSSSSSPSSATSADTSSAKDTSDTDSDTSSSSSEFEESGDGIGEEVPLGEVSKRLSAMPSALKPALKPSNVSMPTFTIDSPLSDGSSESNDRPLSTLIQNKRPVSFHPPRPLLHNQFPPQMYQLQPSSRPISSMSNTAPPHHNQSATAARESQNRVLLPKDNRNEIRAAPSATKSKKQAPAASTGDSSEGSVSDESD